MAEDEAAEPEVREEAAEDAAESEVAEGAAENEAEPKAAEDTAEPEVTEEKEISQEDLAEEPAEEATESLEKVDGERGTVAHKARKAKSASKVRGSMNEGENTIDIAAGETVYYAFTPAKNMSCSFYSVGDYDTFGYLYDSDMEELDSNDDGTTSK